MRTEQEQAGGFKEGMTSTPVNEAKIFLQVSEVHVALAELQLSSRVVVNVVHTHLLHDAKTSLGEGAELDTFSKTI